MRVIDGALQVPTPDDQERLIAMLVSEAQSQRALQATTWDGYETKALSLMALPLATPR